ncbi:hypothetical protein N7532_005123 [Penicillium argentinense]|uniref:NAD(P)-binding domain-containing protein n=1 Tax=Penicillium argentinense TaxID=1131581 RepID=A0A9W9FDW0_9EURO|nr:uncharacterized protein N7532_005123 [Penicillium argentinense]KAJ5098122.1 hypothetical protein N7532_005123 [Penicillium argentinense]
MKVVLTGTTGFAGREVLNQYLQNPSITSIVVLSRCELPAHDKLKVVVLEDFTSYPDFVREAVQGADACIWTLGITGAKAPDDETAHVSIDYTIAAARFFYETCKKPFRFVYCSGTAAERDQKKPLWFMQIFRRIRGQVEIELLAFADEHSGFKLLL